MWRKLLKQAADAKLMRPDLDPKVARMMVLGALNWAAAWWDPRHGSLYVVVRTAQSLVHHGLGTVEVRGRATCGPDLSRSARGKEIDPHPPVTS